MCIDKYIIIAVGGGVGTLTLTHDGNSTMMKL